MRPALDAMHRAGIRRARFSALYGGRTAKGHVALNAYRLPGSGLSWPAKARAILQALVAC